MYTAHSSVSNFCCPFSSPGCLKSNTVSHTSVVTLFAGLSRASCTYKNPSLLEAQYFFSCINNGSRQNASLKNQPEKSMLKVIRDEAAVYCLLGSCITVKEIFLLYPVFHDINVNIKEASSLHCFHLSKQTSAPYTSLQNHL